MAVDAALLVQDRPMHPPLIEGLDDHVVMASLANLEARILEREGRRRRRLSMALVTFSVTDWLMDIVEEYPRGARTMGVMTGATTALFHRIILVLLLEGRAGGLMTAEAETGIPFLQELRTLGRNVRIVALEAVFRHRFMLHLVCRYRPAQFLVAFEAEFAASLYQNHLVITGVWIMA
jgi:hypothetical protein